MVARAKTNQSKQLSLEDVQCIYTGMEELVELHKALIVDLESLFTQYPNIFGLGESFLALVISNSNSPSVQPHLMIHVGSQIPSLRALCTKPEAFSRHIEPLSQREHVVE